MSIFSSRTQKTVEIPMDPPHTATIQKLAGRHLEKARQENQIASIDTMRRMGGAAALTKELESFGDAAKRSEQIAQAQADPLNGYDRSTLVRFGVIAYDGQPLTPEQFDDLDDEFLDWGAREALKLTKPSLFMTEDEAEADRKNG